MIKRLRQFCNDQAGAVAVTYALALTALIALAGVGFDYGRLMALDSEMQSAADEAALAAATQLDGRSGAITRAQDAVNSYFANSSSNVVNRTQMANDRGGSALTSVSFTFYTAFDSATDVFGSTTTTDTAAKVVKVVINSRRAFYAFTPIIGAFNSGNVTADAVAGLEAAICKTPPMMVCRPTNGTDFPTNADIGKGLLMQPGSAGMWAPGTFGYLDFGNGANAVQDLLGSNGGTNACSEGSSVPAQQGNIASAPKYLNTRFDVYENPLTPADCGSNGDKCPAANTRKDMVRVESYRYKNVRQGTFTTARASCNSTATSTNNSANPVVTVAADWSLLPTGTLPASGRVQGFPRDNCHNNASSNSNGTCPGGNYGDAVWNLSGYQAAHTNVPGSLATRYAIYKWERDNPGSGLQPLLANPGDPVVESSCSGPAANRRCDYTWTNYCAYPSPIKGTYHATPKDRRIITVAVVDCSTDTGGAHSFNVDRWMDVFLTEPSWDRDVPYTRASQIYGEIIGPATKPDGTNAFQYYGRQKAVLLQ